MPKPLFSTYSQGEDRITSTILSVFERLNTEVVELILQMLMGDTNRSLVTFQDQPQGTRSRPDGVIRASFAYWIETKIVSWSTRQNTVGSAP